MPWATGSASHLYNSIVNPLILFKVCEGKTRPCRVSQCSSSSFPSLQGVVGVVFIERCQLRKGLAELDAQERLLNLKIRSIENYIRRQRAWGRDQRERIKWVWSERDHRAPVVQSWAFVYTCVYVCVCACVCVHACVCVCVNCVSLYLVPHTLSSSHTVLSSQRYCNLPPTDHAHFQCSGPPPGISADTGQLGTQGEAPPPTPTNPLLPRVPQATVDSWDTQSWCYHGNWLSSQVFNLVSLQWWHSFMCLATPNHIRPATPLSHFWSQPLTS